jgi:hypothetical protein
MKYILPVILLLAIACENEDKGRTLEISTREITLDPAGREQRIAVVTNAPVWEVITNDPWPVIEQDSTEIVISAGSNPTRNPRDARIYIAAAGKFERVNITQEGSLHVFGDPYPDAAAPDGVIYKVVDGGEHGMVISLDQLAAAPWIADINLTTAHTTDYVDGKASTRAIIAAHRDEPDFAVNYPAFAWVLAKNGGSLDGEWYIPSFWETFEMYNFIVGNDAYVISSGPPPSMQLPPTFARPTHNLTVRDEFNGRLAALGGAPVNYAASMYWTSSEATATNAIAISFNNGTDYMHTGFTYYKTNQFFVRAVRKY